MPASAGTGSTLANLAARAANLQRVRARLGMEGAQRGVPQSSMRALRPAEPNGKGPDFDVDSAMEAAASGEAREKLLARIREAAPAIATQEAIDAAPTTDIGGEQIAPSEAPPPVLDPLSMLKPETRPLAERLSGLGAERVSPMEQFARLAGRMPSPRELAVFQGRLILEQQLERPPTSVELKMYMLRPAKVDQSFQKVVG